MNPKIRFSNGFILTLGLPGIDYPLFYIWQALFRLPDCKTDDERSQLFLEIFIKTLKNHDVSDDVITASVDNGMINPQVIRDTILWLFRQAEVVVNTGARAGGLA